MESVTTSVAGAVPTRRLEPLFWVLVVGGALLGLMVLYPLTIFWQTDCPGAAELSAQRRVCDRVGPWGGPVLMALGLALGTVAVVLVRRVTVRPDGRLPAWLMLVAVLAPSAALWGSQLVLRAPSDSCTVEQENEQSVLIEQWRASGRAQGEERPVDRCAANDGS